MLKLFALSLTLERST